MDASLDAFLADAAAAATAPSTLNIRSGTYTYSDGCFSSAHDFVVAVDDRTVTVWSAADHARRTASASATLPSPWTEEEEEDDGRDDRWSPPVREYALAAEGVARIMFRGTGWLNVRGPLPSMRHLQLDGPGTLTWRSPGLEARPRVVVSVTGDGGIALGGLRVDNAVLRVLGSGQITDAVIMQEGVIYVNGDGAVTALRGPGAERAPITQRLTGSGKGCIVVI